MHDIRSIRDDPAAFDRSLARRGAQPAADELMRLDEDRRAAATLAQEALAHRNEASKAIGAAKGRGDADEAERMLAEIADLKGRMPMLEETARSADAALSDALASLPNLPADDTPDGAGEADNIEIARWSTPRTFDFPPLPHDQVAEPLGLDMSAAAAMSGARFAVLRGRLARCQRALGQYLLDAQVAAGWEETAVPLLVRDDAVYGTGQLPKFSDELFHTTDGRWLIPTAEVPLTNMVRDAILDAAALPLRLTALTPCFRSEAGAAGRDTRGLIRQHQFDKVELVTICHPDHARAEHDRMLAAAGAVLRALELPYRTVQLCAGDLGVQSRRTYDLEVWLPSQDTYREISSISWCGDWQARRMDARFRVAGEKGTRFVDTLNGSGVAVGRALVALLENGQRQDGSVDLPPALHPYLPADWGGRLTPP